MFRLLTLFCLLGVLAACGGDASETENSNNNGNVVPYAESEKAELLISLTDAEGDFFSYEVDLNYLHFVRADGTEISVLPHTARINFAEYVDLSEVLTRVSLPPGRYDSVVLGLDYSDAEIQVQTEEGAVLRAQALDEEGSPLGENEVSLQFGDSEGFVLLARQFLNVELDFDLDASHRIDIVDDQAVVHVAPVFLVDTQMAEPKTLRVRGLLKEVDLNDQSLVIQMRPLRVLQGEFGEIELQTTADTHFEVDGEFLNWSAAMEALSALAVSSPMVAYGTWDREEKHFNAEFVLAGSSVAWASRDILRGVVLARDANTITMRAAMLQAGEANSVYYPELQLLASDLTRIFKWRTGAANIEALSVGSTLQAVGEWDETLALFNAEQGIVRLGISSASGVVKTLSPLSIDLHLLSAQRPESFNFSGTGATVDTDADPEHYEIAVGNLPIPNLQEGDLIRATGWIADFSSAPEDFNALSLRDYSGLRSHFVLAYPDNGIEMGISQADENGMVLTLDEAAEIHHISTAGITFDFFTLSGMPLLKPIAERGVFALQLDDQIRFSSHYTQFSTLLDEALLAGYRLQRVDAHGYWKSDSLTFESRRLRVRLVSTAM